MHLQYDDIINLLRELKDKMQCCKMYAMLCPHLCLGIFNTENDFHPSFIQHLAMKAVMIVSVFSLFYFGQAGKCDHQPHYPTCAGERFS